MYLGILVVYYSIGSSRPEWWSVIRMSQLLWAINWFKQKNILPNSGFYTKIVRILRFRGPLNREISGFWEKVQFRQIFQNLDQILVKIYFLAFLRAPINFLGQKAGVKSVKNILPKSVSSGANAERMLYE